MLKTYAERSETERSIIRKAFDYEIEAIKNNSSEKNPYFPFIKKMGLLEAFEFAVCSYFNGIEKATEIEKANYEI